MNLESQVISLPLAKRLKELGVKQKSYAFWILAPKTKGAPETARLLSVDISLSYFINHQEEKTFSAFTVAELGEMLPRGHFLSGRNPRGRFFCQFFNDRGDHWVREKSEADARAREEM